MYKKKDFSGVVMNSEETKILQLNQYWEFYETPSIIYADLQFLIKETTGWKQFWKIIYNKSRQISPADTECLQYGHLILKK